MGRRAFRSRDGLRRNQFLDEPLLRDEVDDLVAACGRSGPTWTWSRSRCSAASFRLARHLDVAGAARSPRHELELSELDVFSARAAGAAIPAQPARCSRHAGPPPAPWRTGSTGSPPRAWSAGSPTPGPAGRPGPPPRSGTGAGHTALTGLLRRERRCSGLNAGDDGSCGADRICSRPSTRPSRSASNSRRFRPRPSASAPRGLTSPPGPPRLGADSGSSSSIAFAAGSADSRPRAPSAGRARARGAAFPSRVGSAAASGSGRRRSCLGSLLTGTGRGAGRAARNRSRCSSTPPPRKEAPVAEQRHHVLGHPLEEEPVVADHDSEPGQPWSRSSSCSASRCPGRWWARRAAARWVRSSAAGASGPGAARHRTGRRPSSTAFLGEAEPLES